MNLDFTQPEIIIGGIIALTVIYKFFSTDKDDEGRIKDSSVTLENVTKVIEGFKPIMNPKLRDGYTEKSIQNQLKKCLQQKFVNVIDEYGIEGANATKIDFDIGNGAIGIELKIAKSLFKTSSLHRLSGQIEDYMEKKYDNDNLLVVVYGEKSHTEERAMLKNISDKVDGKGAEYLYVELVE